MTILFIASLTIQVKTDHYGFFVNSERRGPEIPAKVTTEIGYSLFQKVVNVFFYCVRPFSFSFARMIAIVSFVHLWFS